jgi:hypothetical protein
VVRVRYMGENEDAEQDLKQNLSIPTLALDRIMRMFLARILSEVERNPHTSDK